MKVKKLKVIRGQRFCLTPPCTMLALRAKLDFFLSLSRLALAFPRFSSCWHSGQANRVGRAGSQSYANRREACVVIKTRKNSYFDSSLQIK